MSCAQRCSRSQNWLSEGKALALRRGGGSKKLFQDGPLGSYFKEIVPTHPSKRALFNETRAIAFSAGPLDTVATSRTSRMPCRGPSLLRAPQLPAAVPGISGHMRSAQVKRDSRCDVKHSARPEQILIQATSCKLPGCEARRWTKR